MTEVISQRRIRATDTALRERARAVIPGGMYGHLSVNALPAEYPQFYQRAEGAHVWDVGRQRVRRLHVQLRARSCSGIKHPKVEQAAAAQRGPGRHHVRARTGHGRARGTAGRPRRARGLGDLREERDRRHHRLPDGGPGRDRAAHGPRGGGRLPRRRAVVQPPDATASRRRTRPTSGYYRFNDIASVEQAVAEGGGGDVAAIIVSPFRHDAGFDEEMVRPEFARQLRALCDRIGAALVMDEVRAGFRLHDGGSWEPIGVAPDLSAWSKAIANGYPLAAVLGSAPYAEAAARIFVTGSFWFQSVPMAAAVATIGALREEGAVPAMARIGTLLREGLEREAAQAGVPISQTGPAQMPNLSFPGDENHARAFAFCATAADHGVIVHPRHNWFVSAAHTEADVERALAAARAGFRTVRERFGPD